MHYPSLVLIAKGPLFLQGTTSTGSSGFVQLVPIRSQTYMLSFSLIFYKILSRCPHCFNFDGVATPSLPTGKYFLVYVSGSSGQSSQLSLLLAPFIPLITDDLLVTLPLSVFMVIDVLLRFIPNLFGSLSKMKVPWLQLSKSAQVFRVLPESPCLNFTGTTHILITSIPVFNDAHSATSPSFLSSLASLLHWC